MVLKPDVFHASSPRREGQSNVTIMNHKVLKNTFELKNCYNFFCRNMEGI